MEILTQPMVLEIMDGLACALLAAAAVCKAVSMRAQLFGGVILACLCALACPLFRELILFGPPGALLILHSQPLNALVGALAALAACLFFPQFTGILLFWLDAAGIGLACPVITIMSLPALGVAGALTTGIIAAVIPGLVRDIALGDTAMLIEKNWYASAVVIGAIVAILTVTLLTIYANFSRNLEVAILLGAIATVVARYLGGYKNRY